jgi:hypothetical protein
VAHKLKYRNDSPGVVIREDYVGQAPDVICYPGISSCISITCTLRGGLCGTHLTVSTEADLIDEAVTSLSTAGSRAFTSVHVVGKIGEFKQRTKHSGFRTRKKISALLRKAFNYHGQVLFCDTVGFAQGVHVGVVRGPGNPAFSWQDEKASVVTGFTTPDVTAWTAISNASFMPR